jgi:four helix bundle protein
MRRSASSIPTNLAEGCGRQSDRELARYTAIAQGSAAELNYQLKLCRDLGYVEPHLADELALLTDRVRMMLHGLRRRLRTDQ